MANRRSHMRRGREYGVDSPSRVGRIQGGDASGLMSRPKRKSPGEEAGAEGSLKSPGLISALWQCRVKLPQSYCGSCYAPAPAAVSLQSDQMF